MASNQTKCANCGSDEIDYDPARGDAACVACGMVVQQSLIVNEVAYAEDSRGRSNMVGQHVGADGQPFGAKNGPGSSVLPGHSPAATANTMHNARRQMFNLSSQLKLSVGHVDQAVRLYRLAVERNFHRGRRVLNLSCACLYVVCRMERTPHMLLDFADVARTNVFTLGHTFLKLVRLLEISLPLVDPSLYMHRFAARLEFGEAHNAVAITALRIAARMQRDWMTHGRRPAGLCGAALMTASVMHNFYRSQAEVARVVRIGNVVLRNRLRELDQTSTARLTVAQIESGGGDDGKQSSLKITDTDGQQSNPPAFDRNQEKKRSMELIKRKKGTRKRKRRDGQSAEDGDDSESSEHRKERQENERSKQMAADERVEKLMQEAMASDAMQALDEESKIAAKLSRSAEARSVLDDDGANGNANETQSPSRRRKRKPSKNMIRDDDDDDGDDDGDDDDDDDDDDYDAGDTVRLDENVGGAAEDWQPEEVAVELSDLDDEDAAKYISTDAEYKRKEELWVESNREYLERQAYLERIKVENPEEYERIRPGSSKRRRSSTSGSLGTAKSHRRGAGKSKAERDTASASLATQVRRSSKKINYEVLQTLEEDGDLGA